MKNKILFKGYVQGSPFGNYYIPARFQIILLRDYINKIKQNFGLPLGEPIFSNTKILLRTMVQSLKSNEAIVCLSVNVLPKDSNARVKLLKKIIKNKSQIHFIFENIIIKKDDDIEKIEKIFYYHDIKK